MYRDELARPNAHFQNAHTLVFEKQAVVAGSCDQGIQRIRPRPRCRLFALSVGAHIDLPNSNSPFVFFPGGAGILAKNSATMPIAAANMLISKARV